MRNNMKEYDVIIRPILTEKSYADISNKKYTFEVRLDANKTEIKKAVEKVFGVKVDKVNTTIIRGKLKTQGKTQGYTSTYKKAYVTLSQDSKSIEFFDSLS